LVLELLSGTLLLGVQTLLAQGAHEKVGEAGPPIFQVTLIEGLPLHGDIVEEQPSLLVFKLEFFFGDVRVRLFHSKVERTLQALLLGEVSRRLLLDCG